MKTLVACLALAAVPAAAQERVDERRPAAADGTVAIETGAGAVRVSGWDRNEVAVTGTLGSGAERLVLRGGERQTRVEVEPAEHSHFAEADLDVKVPAGSQIRVESFNARIEVTGVRGGVRAETVNGGISVTGSGGEVHVESVNGGVTVRGGSARIHAESVNGRVEVSDPGSDLRAGTVNAPLTVTGSPALQRGHLESVNGRVRFDGALAPRATLEVETVSGRVELGLAAAAADFNISTFSGRITNELGPAARRSQRSWERSDEGGDDEGGREIVFSVGGGGGARVTVQTLSGAVTIRAPQIDVGRERKD